MRCGNDADAVVAICVDVSTHSADVAQNQPSIVVVAGTEDSGCEVDVTERATRGRQLLRLPGARCRYSARIPTSTTICSSVPQTADQLSERLNYEPAA